MVIAINYLTWTKIEKQYDNLLEKTTSYHIDYSCKTMMPYGMLMSFVVT
jgi:hypothetical protein